MFLIFSMYNEIKLLKSYSPFIKQAETRQNVEKKFDGNKGMIGH